MITDELLVHRLKTVYIVWGHHKDDWIKYIAKPLASRGKREVLWRFLVKKETPAGKFECIKEN